jgi:hypothetical protein
MKKFISLAVASLAVATCVPGVTQAQTSSPASPRTAPNLTPVTPSNSASPDSAPLTPGNNTAPLNTPGMPSNSNTPSTSTPTTATPSAEIPGTCGPKISSTGMTSSGTGMASSGTNAESYKTSTSSSNVPLMKLNTNPAITAPPTSTSTSASTSYSTSTVENAPRLLDASSDEIEHNNLIGPAHYIKLAVGSSPLCYLSLTPLQEVYATDSIKVLDQSGKGVPAVVTKQNNGSAKISFEQPISAGSNLVLALQGVEYDSTLTPTTVQYYISGGFANYSEEIPYGVAQVQRYVK